MPPGRQTTVPGRALGGDDGFVLLESIVSITLITVVMAALTSLFVAVTRIDGEQRARQVAVQVADTAVSYVRSLPTSDLVTGRSAAAVDAQWAAAPVDVTPYLTAMEKAVAPGTTVLPLTLRPQVVHGVTYTVDVYLGWCQTTPVLGSAACLTPTTPGAVRDQLRAVIGVSWPDRQCAPLATTGTPTCSYVSSTLISTQADPVFTLNQPAPTLPVITLPSFAGLAVGDPVALSMDVAPGTGVPVLTWATTNGSWPAGVSMDPAGRITGTITAASSPTLTVTVTDGFARTVSTTFTWSVLPALTASGPSTRDDVLGTAIPSLALGASGGAGAPYTWSVPSGTLPPGLTLDTATGVVSGTPSPVTGRSYPTRYAVVFTVSDSAGHRAIVALDWTILRPLVVTAPTTRTDTVNNPIATFSPVATGGTGTYTWSSTALPSGLTLDSATGAVTGTPRAVGASDVTVSVSDGRRTSSATVRWTVVAPPTVTSPGDLTSQVGSPVKIALSTTCPAGPCTYALSGGPAGVGVDASGLMTGTVAGGNKTYTVTLAVTDANGVTATSAAFRWTVGSQGSVSATWPVVTGRGLTVEQPLSYSCPSKNSKTCTVSVTGQPSGVGLTSLANDLGAKSVSSVTVASGSSGILYLSGTVATGAPLASAKVTLSIAGGVNDSDSGTWTVR